MAKVTPGFKLYLYQLLARELGFGKQTLLPQVEEVLREDDIIPEDLECSSVQKLVEACPDFLKLTVFKKGRVYATVLRNEEWDAMLTAPPEKPAAPAKKGGAGGPKTWKKKKGGKKVFKPVKPGKHRREREAAEEAARIEAEEAAARAAAEAAELERKQAEEAARAEAEAAEAAARAEAEAAQQAAAEEARLAAEREQAAQAEAAVEATEPQPTRDPDAPQARTIAEILAESRAEEARQAAEREQAAQAQAAEQAEQVQTAEQAEQAQPAEEPAPTAQPAGADEPTAAPAPAPEPEAAPAVPEPTPEPEAAPAVPEPAPEPEAAPEPEPPADEIPPAPEPSPISLTITYDPYEDMERELERQRAEQPPVLPRRKPEPTAPQPSVATQAPAAPPIPLGNLPQDFGTEVACKDALLRALYQLLPYDVEPIAVLDEDWRMARSTGTISGSRTRVTFPLRYLHEDGTPITATLRKSARTSFGKQWNLTLVDGDDGSGETHLSVGYEGLPAADEGAWSDLGGTVTDTSASPIRTLVQDVVIGTWDSFLGALSAAAAPERWNYPGEGVGRQSRFGILREYIATTYLRATRQDRIATSADGSFAAFHTGLSTSLGDDIYACLTERSGDIPWHFAGFATAGSGELGARLTGTIAELPMAPTYLATLEDVVASQERMVILDTESILGRQLGRLPRAFLHERLEGNAAASEILSKRTALLPADITTLSRIIKSDASAYRRLRRALDDAVEQAMRAARASYRIAAPVFDPADDRTKLLVPLCLVEDGTADCALVLDLQPSGAYRAAAILPLERAYACARVISREQPGWLSAQRVLG